MNFDGHAWRLAKTCFELRKENKYTDIVLSVSDDKGERNFNAHKLILIAGSKYFTRLFNAPFLESQAQIIKIHENPDIFEYVINFMCSFYVATQHKSVALVSLRDTRVMDMRRLLRETHYDLKLHVHYIILKSKDLISMILLIQVFLMNIFTIMLI